MTDDEHDLLAIVYAEAQGQAERWVAVIELPVVAMAMARNGYITVMQDSPDLWHVALTEPGRVLALQLARSGSRSAVDKVTGSFYSRRTPPRTQET